MAVFSEILPDSEIMSIVNKQSAHRIFLACCNGCTNESLAYTNRVPIFKSPNGQQLSDAFKNGDEIPYASLKEAQRIRALLEINGCSVEYGISRPNEIFCIRCVGGAFSFEKILSRFKPDMILSLSCPAGACGLQDGLLAINSKIPVIRLMRPLGQIAYMYIDTETERNMIYDKVKICKNN